MRIATKDVSADDLIRAIGKIVTEEVAKAKAAMRLEYSRVPSVRVEPAASPNVEIENVVPTPNVEVANHVQIHTKDLADPLASSLVAGFKAAIASLADRMDKKHSEIIGQLESLTKAILRLADRPAPVVNVPPANHPPRPKAFRLETDENGIRRALPEYD